MPWHCTCIISIIYNVMTLYMYNIDNQIIYMYNIDAWVFSAELNVVLVHNLMCVLWQLYMDTVLSILWEDQVFTIDKSSHCSEPSHTNRYGLVSNPPQWQAYSHTHRQQRPHGYAADNPSAAHYHRNPAIQERKGGRVLQPYRFWTYELLRTWAVLECFVYID